MVENIAQNKYTDAVDSYTALNVSSKVRGQLIEKQDKNIRIDIGDNQVLDIELREDIDIKKGETVLVDRRNILKSKVIDLKDQIKIEHGDIDSYSKVLESLDIEVSEENIKIMKRLDNYGIDMTRENLETYMIAKNSLDEISTSLDYDSVIRLIEMDVDVENESIQELASLVEGLEEEKEGFKILNIFKKKELTTEEAEDIAKELYGNKMGKDITDIIKSLHKKKVNITKRNIEKINDVFYKLDNLKNIEDKTFVDTIKNKLDINIDNLYKVKRYVKDESVNKVDSEITSKNIINIRGYEIPTISKTPVTNKDLRLLEEDIEDLMVDLDLEPSKENIKLSKEFIKRDMHVTKENIASIDEMKKALVTIVKDLDKETAAQLTKANIDIETTDIRVIAEKIEILKNPEKLEQVEVVTDNEVKVKPEEIEYVRQIKDLKKELIEVIENAEKKSVDIKSIQTDESSSKDLVIDKDRSIDLEVKNNDYVKEIQVLKEEVIKVIDKAKDEGLNIELADREIVKLDQELTKLIESTENKVLEIDRNQKSVDIKSIPTDDRASKDVVIDKDRSIDLEVKNNDYVNEIKVLKEEVIKLIDKAMDKTSDIELADREMSELDPELTKPIGSTENELLKIDKKVDSQATINENVNTQDTGEIDTIDKLMEKVESLQKVEEKDILTLLEKNIDFKIDKIEQVIFGKREALAIDKIEDITYTPSSRPQNSVSEEIMQASLDGIDKISTAFTKIGKLDFNTIAFQLKRNIPMTLVNIQKTSDSSHINENIQDDQKEYQENEMIVAKQALTNNGLNASRLNIQKSMQAYRSYNNLKDNLTSNMVKQSVSGGVKIENMEINTASKFVDEYKKTEEIDTRRYADAFNDSAYEIAKNSDENIMFLIKNKKPFSFKELKETNSIFKNQNQLGHKISQLDRLISENGEHATKEKFENLKKEIMQFSKNMKGSKRYIEEVYKRVEESIKDIEENMRSINQDSSGMMKKKFKEVSEKIDESKVLAKDNKIIQLPLYMNEQFTNLNMYFRDREKEKSKKDSEDISVVLSIDTVNMGNININLDIEKKNINIKIGLEELEDRKLVESHKDALEKLLKQGGYSIGEISFYGEEEIDILGLEEVARDKPNVSNSNLDITI